MLSLRVEVDSSFVFGKVAGGLGPAAMAFMTCRAEVILDAASWIACSEIASLGCALGYIT